MRPGTSIDVDNLVVWVEGDTWNGLPSVTIENPLAPGDLAAVKMAFKPTAITAEPALELTTADNQITISDAANWSFTVNPGQYDLIPGTYVWQIEVTDDSNPAYVQTIIHGSGEVLNNYTTTA